MTVYCGVDLHTRQQLIKWCDTRDGEIKEERLSHESPDSVRSFYSRLTGEVIVGIEACGYSEWFETMLRDLGHEVWVGDSTKIRYRARSRQKTDRRDAELLLDLLLKGEFPRVSRLSFESLEVLRRLRYRHRLVQMRTRMRNSLQSIAHGCGVALGPTLRSKRGRERLNALPLSPVLSQQRSGWLEMIEEVGKRIARVEEELEQAAAGDGRVRRLRTHPGIGLLTGLALVHTLCPVERFADSRKVTAYAGLEPREHTSGERKRMGHISKAGPRVLRFLLVEAGIKATREDADLSRLYYRVMHRREQARAKVAVARHLLVHAFIMLRDEIDYEEFKVRGADRRSAARTVHRPQVPDHLIGRPASE